MPESLAIYAPLLPELILAIGAMVLLMYGAFRPETQDEAVRVGWLAILLLIAAGAAMAILALVADRLVQGFAEERRKALGL